MSPTTTPRSRRGPLIQTLRTAGEIAVRLGRTVLDDLAVKHQWPSRRFARKQTAGLELLLPFGMDEVVGRIAGALREQGFGILTRIDVHTILQEKLGVAFRPYLILGACNPALAHRALSTSAEAGLLLPCNITVEQLTARHTVVRIANPDVMLQVGALGMNPELRAVATEATRRLWLVADALRAGPPSTTA